MSKPEVLNYKDAYGKEWDSIEIFISDLIGIRTEHIDGCKPSICLHFSKRDFKHLHGEIDKHYRKLIKEKK